MRRFALATMAWLLVTCGQSERDNPLDPGGTNREPAGPIQLTAQLPLDSEHLAQIGARLVSFRFEVTAADMEEPIEGEMSLVGTSARAQVEGITDGADRVFSVDVFDRNNIRTFTAADTVDVDATRGVPRRVALQLRRLQGNVELTSELPPEVVVLEVVIEADGDTLLRVFEDVEGRISERISGVPTGTDVSVLLRGVDVDTQVLIETQVLADVRAGLVSHITVPVETGVLHIEANFPSPTYIPLAVVDRFSGAAGTFFRRSENPNLPDPEKPIDFDDELFLLKGIGSNREGVTFYNFDVRSPIPAPVYFLIDRRDDPIAGQLPVFDHLPGEEGHSDIFQVFQVKILDGDYQVNSITSRQEIFDEELEVIDTETFINAIIVPDGSKASRRFDAAAPAELFNGWYKDQILKYLLFENGPSAQAIVISEGRINTPQMFAFLENKGDITEGFALDASTGKTHNVFTSLPDDEGGYAPLWAVHLFKLEVFEKVQDVASALEQTGVEDNQIILPELPNLFVNAPIVGVE